MAAMRLTAFLVAITASVSGTFYYQPASTQQQHDVSQYHQQQHPLQHQQPQPQEFPQLEPQQQQPPPPPPQQQQPLQSQPQPQSQAQPMPQKQQTMASCISVPQYLTEYQQPVTPLSAYREPKPEPFSQPAQHQTHVLVHASSTAPPAQEESEAAPAREDPNMSAASVAAIVRQNALMAQRRAKCSPSEVLASLEEANLRSSLGLYGARNPSLSPLERRALTVTQTPLVAVLSCADSRVPVEQVFGQVRSGPSPNRLDGT
eukprot:6186449-Pleurochrysis_carterae.AAC.4